jgi:P-type Cu+ transporter
VNGTISFPVYGMTCTSCVVRITRVVKRIDGVGRVKVDLGREMVTVERQSAALDALLASAITAAGYEPDLSVAIETDAPPSLIERARRFVRFMNIRKGTLS